MNQPWIYMYSHPEPPSHLPPHPIPLGHPSAPAPSTCLMHPTWTGDLFHNWIYTCFDAILSDHPTLAFSQSPEAEDIKKRWQEYTEELYKKDLYNTDNHKGVITHTLLEPDILECEVRWALGSITMNKASGGDGIPVELFQILKDDAVKVLYSIPSKFGKLSSSHRTG